MKNFSDDSELAKYQVSVRQTIDNQRHQVREEQREKGDHRREVNEQTREVRDLGREARERRDSRRLLITMWIAATSLVVSIIALIFR